jgi:hypothetical protein
MEKSMIEDAGPGVKNKANTKFCERVAKHPGRWDLVNELRHRITEV